MDIREAFEKRGLTAEVFNEAVQHAEELKAAGYNDETVSALYESYLEKGTVIKGAFTLEKLMMVIDPDEAFTEFWEGTNA